MPSTKDIKNRISSVKETQKITNAMFLIASIKLQKAKRDLAGTRPFFDSVKGEIKRIFRVDSELESPYFYPPSGERDIKGAYGYLIITSDKGLAGAYNQNIFKEADAVMNRYKDHEHKLFVIGEYGRSFYHARKTPIEEDFICNATTPTLQRARTISSLLLDEYMSGNLKKIYVIYTDMTNGMETKASSFRLLPFHRKDFEITHEEARIDAPFEFFPNIVSVLHRIIPSYVTGIIYSAMIDSFCAEQSSRMSAMDSANRNAEELVSKLTVTYNHMRQAAITQEISEICGAAKAMRRKREAAKKKAKQKAKEKAL